MQKPLNIFVIGGSVHILHHNFVMQTGSGFEM